MGNAVPATWLWDAHSPHPPHLLALWLAPGTLAGPWHPGWPLATILGTLWPHPKMALLLLSLCPDMPPPAPTWALSLDHGLPPAQRTPRRPEGISDPRLGTPSPSSCPGGRAGASPHALRLNCPSLRPRLHLQDQLHRHCPARPPQACPQQEGPAPWPCLCPLLVPPFPPFPPAPSLSWEHSGTTP